MILHQHLPTELQKIQAGVSLPNARSISRNYLAKFVSSATLDVDLILGHICRVSRLDLYVKKEKKLSQSDCEKIVSLLLRRAKFEPIAYLIGEKEFFDLKFTVNEKVLIPRPDTELMVEHALEILTPESKRVVDVCTGSGCIAVSIAKSVPHVQIIACDISEEALAVAKKNAFNNGVGGRIEFRSGDLLDPVGSHEKADLIVCNPPYIRPDEMDGLMRDVKEYEPHLALVGEDEDGLGLHRRMLLQSLQVLGRRGVLLMEIGQGQSEDLGKVDFAGYSNPEFLKDYSGINRVAKYTRLNA